MKTFLVPRNISRLPIVGVWLLMALVHTTALHADDFQDNIRIQTDSNPVLRLDTTSGSAHVWKLQSNDNNFFIIDDSFNSTPFRIVTSAPGGAMMIDSDGDVGLGTTFPSANLHILRSDDVVVQLNPSTGFSNDPRWNLIGTAGNFIFADGISGTAPLQIEAAAPDNLLHLSGLGYGHVGIGTGAPELIAGTSAGGARHLNINANSGEARAIVQGKTAAEWYIVHKGGATNQKIVRARVQNGKYFLSTVLDNLSGTLEPHAFCIDMANGNIGIKTGTPLHPLQVGDGGQNDGNAAHVTKGGVWTNASSREFKRDIRPLDSQDAFETLRSLQPVRYRYKNEPDEEYLGFIAEDVPELVATRDRKSLAAMDIAAVLVRASQEHNRTLADLQRHDEQQDKALAQREESGTALQRQLDRQREVLDQRQQTLEQQEVSLVELERRLTNLEQN